MLLYDDGELPVVTCDCCKRYSVYPEKSKCTRFIYPKTLLPVRSCFSCDVTCGKHCICSDFEPTPLYKDVYKRWTTIEEYAAQAGWKQDNDKAMNVFLNGDTSVMYSTTLGKFRYGEMVEAGGLFYYNSKIYHRQSRKSPCGYDLVHEGAGVVKLMEG